MILDYIPDLPPKHRYLTIEEISYRKSLGYKATKQTAIKVWGYATKTWYRKACGNEMHLIYCTHRRKDYWLISPK